MILTLLGPINSQTIDVNWFEVQTNEGSFIIKHGHAPMVAILAKNKELTLELKDGSQTVMTVSGGILEIDREAATLLLLE